MVGGRRTRCVDVVTLSKGAVGKEVTEKMAEAVLKLRTLFQVSGREWHLSGRVWGLHDQSEVL